MRSGTAYDWSTALCLCLCLCRLRFHSSQSYDISPSTRRTSLSVFFCVYAYAYVDPVSTCLHKCLCLCLCLCASKNQSKGAVDIFTFPPLNVNWTFRGEEVRQLTLVRDVLEKSKRMPFYKFYVTCGTALVSLFMNTYRSTMPFSRWRHCPTVTTKILFVFPSIFNFNYYLQG